MTRKIPEQCHSCGGFCGKRCKREPVAKKTADDFIKEAEEMSLNRLKKISQSFVVGVLASKLEILANGGKLL